MIIGFLLLLQIHHINAAFSPDRSNYDAYGVKIAMNDIFLVQAQNAQVPPSFFIQFAPYNNTQSSLQCSINYDNIQNYVYTVAVGKNPNQNQVQFFFAGEVLNTGNGTFIGVAKYNLTSNVSNPSNFCAAGFSYSTQYLTNYAHQEYYIIGVEPKGLLVYGFANDFIFIFDSQNVSTFESWNSSLTWPNVSFTPHAVDISDNFGVVAGFIKDDPTGRVKFSPIIYLLNFNSSNRHPIVVGQYVPDTTSGTWQDLLTNDDADIYSAKYSMSISIDSRGYVLVGMQFTNRVFLFSVNISNPISLVNVSRNTNGRSLGNGKSVAWLDNGNMAAILVNTYSLAYQWVSSQIYLYDMTLNNYSSTSTPLSIFPNYHQSLPAGFSSTFLNIASSSTSLTLMDDIGTLLIFIPTGPGLFPSMPGTASVPTITSAKGCLPGMYKSNDGINDCILCPAGTKASGNSSINCTPCASTSLCSLGSTGEVSISKVQNRDQVIAYPESPDSTIFEEILIHNMFHIGSGRCLVISPLFWSLIVAGLAFLVIIVVAILHFCTMNPEGDRVKKKIQYTFKKIDMIREGELWVGGLASLSLIVMLSFAYAFSNGYFKEYPIESVSDFYLACDTSMRNAKFQTGLQPLGIAHDDSEKEMLYLLDGQSFTLNVAFLNTLIDCDVISIQALFGTTWLTTRWSSCANINSVLSLSIPLPSQKTSIEISIDDIGTIGALRIGLSGPTKEEDLHYLRELNAYQSFSQNGSALAHTLAVSLTTTKIINETIPIDGHDSNYTGIYVLTYGADLNSLFLSQGVYSQLTSTETVLTVAISESTYYVKNRQEPIVKRAELIFHNLLFTVVCFEIFGLLFVIYKLIFEPTYQLIVRMYSRRRERYRANDQRNNEELTSIDHRSNGEPPMVSAL
ncbi:unnamed protein product [Rotaria magnacalcarata]|nr:unnamed protein product [Rotaria magnacalcarata]CAF4062522.1 unnamed protein product [Rotaria magnacalcarata]CAF4080670.1 unnamed protein product [Rotaria magnacalcarata]CAF4105438.1 unnamed protein product [Rotaria magnacalcarata]